MPNHEGSGNMTGNSGNGYAKITLVSIANGNIGYFDAVGREETFTASKSGYYELEVWGAQGGSVTGYRGGYGGYSDGIVYLDAGDTLYVNVGTQGASGNPTGKINGGYNGGGWLLSLQSKMVKQDNMILAISFCMDGQPAKVEQGETIYYPVPSHVKGTKDKIIDIIRYKDVTRDEILWHHYINHFNRVIEVF